MDALALVNGVIVAPVAFWLSLSAADDDRMALSMVAIANTIAAIWSTVALSPSASLTPSSWPYSASCPSCGWRVSRGRTCGRGRRTHDERCR